ncbi:MAG: FAD-dependent oxidoreductase [Chitinophagales bacterium]|nr:FAD-dependent oxidoreductase [Chitinophagales bacterium]MCZ2392795.1 FAD-dependent oxidoreductase [Chitinophagales bacterium]
MVDVIVVGAGISGLSTAYHLQSAGCKVLVLEANGKAGGRCRSDYINGYILDRGLHFLQKGYEESKSIFNYKNLRLESIYPGALLHYNNNFHLITNPLKKIGDSLALAFSPFMTFKDKIKMGAMLSYLMVNSEEQFKKLKNISTKEFLELRGFSSKFIDHFFKPLHQAIFYDNTLSTSAYVYALTFKNFAFEESALPAYGIGSLALQLADQLDKDTIRFHTKVKEVFHNGVLTSSGEFVEAKKVVVSIPPYDIKKIMPKYESNILFSKNTCMYFSTQTPPVKSPIILLNGQNKGIVNHIFVPSTIQPTYAPTGHHLVCVNLKGYFEKDEDELIDEVLKELINWFGIKVNNWAHLKTYHIQHGLPQISTQHQFELFEEREEIYYCGDYFSYGTINNALLSGKAVAEEVVQKLAKSKFSNRKKGIFS